MSRKQEKEIWTPRVRGYGRHFWKSGQEHIEEKVTVQSVLLVAVVIFKVCLWPGFAVNSESFVQINTYQFTSLIYRMQIL